ncbi:hypothetical protein LMG27952_05640 [Paraburkholderia hiiakae]|uniref:Uncharacterized protein n=1 Tax=Paraburkholderia hiiakae TaxID=1081782 RepID=A0ABM8P2R9_9BURK|nr:hypothetical protein LMG27952_05640 [Paraburkholderia hiiakae]
MQAQGPLVKKIWNIYFWGRYTDYVRRNFLRPEARVNALNT